jgi:putative FmdB family regulatory protein
VVGIGLMVFARHGRNTPIPFGPYLAAAGIIALFWGPQLTRGYLGLIDLKIPGGIANWAWQSLGYNSRFWRIPMPIYEYRCDSCGFQKEHLQKMSDPQLTTCPECGKESYGKHCCRPPAFQLKGSGWYATDFKGGGKRPKPESVPPCQTGEGAAHRAWPADQTLLSSPDS